MVPASVESRREIQTVVLCTLLLVLSNVHCAAAPEQAPLPPFTVTFDQPVHFITPDGNATVAAPGTHLVEPADTNGLRLSPENMGARHAAVVVEAVDVDLGVELEAPAAVHIVWKEDEHHVIFLWASGKGLEAVGSASGIRARGNEVRPLPNSVIRDALDHSQ